MKHQRIRRAAALALALVLSMSLTVPAWAEDGDGESAETPALTVTSDKTEPLKIGETATLTAKWTGGEEPEKGITATYSWSCDKEDVVGLSGKTGESVTVTAKAGGTAKITLTATPEDGEAVTAKYELTVATPGLTITTTTGGTTILWTSKTTNWNLSALLSNGPEGTEITWSVDYVTGYEYTKLPRFKTEKDPAETGTGETVTVVSSKGTVPSAGEFIFTATAVKDGKIVGQDSKRVTISGIVLTGPKLVTDQKTEKDLVEMYVGASTTLTVETFGDAGNSTNAAKVEWGSDNASVVSVMNNGGNLNAWGIGTAVIRATKGDYWAECTVTVKEDESVIADNSGHNYKATASEPLKFWDNDPNLDVGLYAELNSITKAKTKEMSDAGIESPLDYITNLKVAPSQGTLYYNYSTDSDTGDGVGYTDRFAKEASGSTLALGKLYFVPAPGFSGTADITFSGVAQDGQNFAGTIRVTVGSGGGSQYQISYRARAGEPVWFLADDFNTFCQGKTGRSYNSVTFNLPKTGEGTLYYNYVAETGSPVTTTTQFTPSGRYTLDDVCFVPNAVFQGKVTINFRAVDTAGDVVNGTLTVDVVAASVDGNQANVTVSGERGRPVALLGSLFNAACQESINDVLSFVTFKLPDPDEGSLYVNYRGEEDYDSRVTAATRYYYSGVPGINSVSFVPASGAAGRVAIAYTGYGSSGASFSGTLYITLSDVDRSTIYYSVAKGGSVTFRASDFYDAGLYKVGAGVTYVTFDVPNTGLGTLYYNYRGNNYYNAVVRSNTSYYYSPSYSWQNRLGLISFRAEDMVGTVTIPYKAYRGTNTEPSFTGVVVIQVGALAPEDVVLSCNTGGQARLWASTLDSVCEAVMSGSLSYIEITSVPAPEEGRLYLNYNGFGTGTAVKQGNRFYSVGSPGIGQISFVPHARFAGKAEITYIGYSVDGGEQVSGRIVVNVSGSTASQYFNDMSGHMWAVDSVDYLRRNGTVIGVGDNYFDPSGTVTKGDFALMLVRAYNLTASGTASFNDVPAGSYYANAIRIAALLGVAGGSNGNFYPKATLSRQDAIVMIFNTLKVSGKTTTNGLAADLSAYTDEGQIAAYAREAMGNLVQMGVVKGDGNGCLQPLRELTRAEAAMLLHTIMTL